MSDEIEIIIDSNETIVESELIIDVVNNNNIVDIESSEPDVVVTFKKQEYVIVGDDMYIPLSYDEAPQWLKDTIANITDLSLTQKITELNSLTSTLNGLINELNIAKNTYTMSIINSAEIDERINAKIETLNSSIADSQANIVDMISTKATPTEASSLALNVLTSSINGGAIGSLVGNIQNTITTNTSTLANNIDIVHSEMTGEFEATADVIDTIQTYVGIDGVGASTNTGLSAYLQGSDGTIGSADSKVANNVYVDSNGITRSKFEYNSSLKVGGTSYNSGFGLATSLTDSSIPIGDSQFWINASKFKFTNNNKTGQVAPFTIDATGTTPEITFNGKVSFSNINNVPTINKTYVQASQPNSGMNQGDTWIDTDDNNSLYSYNGTTWNKTQSGNKTFLQAAAPTNGMIAGDTWVDSDNNYKQYRYSGSAWVEYLYNPATAINTGTTTINGPKITTGSITALQIAANSVTADKISSYNLTSTNATFGNSIIGNAQIVDGSITNAKIVNLSVDTLKISDQAITIPISTINYNQVGFAQEYVEVAAIGFWSSGAPVNLFLSSVLSAGSLRSVNAKVTRDGIAIYDSVTTSVGQSAGQYGNIVFNLRDTCGAGYHEYRFYLLSSAGTTYATLSTILGLEVKK